MNRSLDFTRYALLVVVFLLWWWMIAGTFSPALNLAIIVGGPLLVCPVAWLGRRALDRQPTVERAAWVTTFVHYGVGGLLGAALIRATLTQSNWPGWTLPVPPAISLPLVILSGAALLLAVINLALKGLGAPFAIALSQKLAVDWLYAWTRNPMILAALAFLVSLGLWFQSALYVFWALALFAFPVLYFVKVYEERELEIRFGASYLAYKARTPLLFPRRPH